MTRKIIKAIMRFPAFLRGIFLWFSLPVATRETISEIRTRKLTYLSKAKLAAMAYYTSCLEDKPVPGLIIEAGCALGGSSILMASVKNRKREMRVYDVFGLIPPPTEQDTPDVHARYKVIKQGKSKGIGGNEYYGYQDDLESVVLDNFRAFDVDKRNVILIKGLVQDTLRIDQPVVMAHIDVDWYDPVKTCLERIFPLLVPGGVMIMDDYFDWGGCKRATDEYLQTVNGSYALDKRYGSLVIVKR